jgi:flagellar biosynthesis/type III secretory pathway protein FliH
LSRIIKPSDKQAFDSAKRFEKEPFAINAKPDDANSAQGNPRRAKGYKPDRRLQLERPDTDDLLKEAERKANQLVREAERKAARIREEALERGRAEGLEEVRKKTEEQFKGSSLMLSAFIEQMKGQESDLMRLLTPRLANLAADLAQKIIHREIEKDSSIVASQAEEAIGKILEREKLIIRVNPADVDLMKKHKTVLLGMFDGIDKIEVVGDKKIERGGCIVETNLIRVDAQPGSQLEAARKTLLAETEK